jgi:uncharacterized protein RhaS with RHS repeats
MNIGISPAILALLTTLLFLTQGAHAYRDPETGTFITRDPAGFVDGPNVYGYVRQNPWTKFDPHGLYETGGGDPFDSKTPRWTSTTDKNGKSVVKVIHGGEMFRSDATVESYNAKQSGNWNAVIARAKHMAVMEKSSPGISALNHKEVVAGVDPEYNAKLNTWADTMAAFSPADVVNPNRSLIGGGGKGCQGSPTGMSARDVHKQTTEIVTATSGSNAAKSSPGPNTKVINLPETTAAKPVKPAAAVDEWNNFLGPGTHTNIHPRTGAPDQNRIVSADGTRSIRYGNHEMGSKPTKHHYHEEKWFYDPATDTMSVDNTIKRVPLK